MPRPIVSNNMPVIGWAFMIVWLSLVAAITWMHVRDSGISPPPRSIPVPILACFWLFGAGAGAFFFSIPRTSVTAEGSSIVVRRRWLIGAREERMQLAGAVIDIVEETDTDGDPYFCCRLTTPSGRVVNIKEGHRRAEVEAARARLLAAQ